MINFIKLTGAQTLDDLLAKLVIGDIYYIENTDNTFIRYFLVPKKKEYVGMKYAEDKASLLSESLEQFVFKKVNLTFTANTDTTIKVYFTKKGFDSNKPDDTISLTANQEKTTTYDRKSIYKFTFNYPNFITSAKIDGVVLNCIELFKNCSRLTSLDVSHFDTSKVTDMSSMFYYCSGLTSLDVSHFDTSKVTDMNYMFSGCSGLTSLDVSHFDTSKVTKMNNMFDSCTELTTIGPVDTATGWQHKPNEYSSMFTNCPAKPLPTWYE